MCGYYYFFCDYFIIIIIIIIIITLQFSFHSVAVILILAQRKQIGIYIYIQRTTQNTVQATQNPLNTSTHINKTPTQNQKTQNIVTCKIYFFCVLTLFR